MRFVTKTIAVALVGAPVLAHAAPAPRSADIAAVKAVLKSYQSAVERLDARGTSQLFSTDSTIFETGSSEGNYANYLAHHLTPELAEFKSFKYSDYKVSVRFEGPTIALADETYRYRIETKSGQIAVRDGAATSVLRKRHGKWQIISSHNSAHKPAGG